MRNTHIELSLFEKSMIEYERKRETHPLLVRMDYTSKQQKSNNTYYESDVFSFSFLVKRKEN